MALAANGKTAYDAYDFNAAITDRGDAIDAIGNGANQYAQEAAQRRLALKQAADAEAAAQAAAAQAAATNKNNAGISKGAHESGGITTTPGTAGSSGSGGSTGKKGDNADAFINAISGQESGGSYGVVNRDSGALGKYQVMPSNIAGSGGWDKEALGYNISTAQYLASPELQEQLAGFKLKQYYDKYGAAGAAVAWYAGPSAADRYVRSGKISTSSEGNYPTQYAYVQSVLRRMGL